MPLLLFGLVLALLPLAAPPRAALPPGAVPLALAVTLNTRAGEARALTPPGEEPPPRRPIATAMPGETPRIRWSVRNADRGAPVQDVVIHGLVVRENAPGERIPLGLRRGSVLDTVLGTTIAPGGAVTGTWNTPIHEPGAYLVEIEVLDPQGNRRAYCAADLQVGG